MNCRRRNEARNERKNEGLYAENLISNNFDFDKGLNISDALQTIKVE